MGVTTTLVLIAVILITVLVFAPELLEGLINDTTGLYTATQLKPRVNADEIICDLKFTVDADIVQDFNTGQILLDSKPKIRVNGYDYTWYDCFSRNNPSKLSLLDWNEFHGVGSQLAFLVTKDTVITSEIKLIDLLDSSQQVSSALQPQLKSGIQLKSWSTISTPYDVSRTFVVTDIPARNFNVEIYYLESSLLTGIGDMEHGKPYVVRVCEVGKAKNSC